MSDLAAERWKRSESAADATPEELFAAALEVARHGDPLEDGEKPEQALVVMRYPGRRVHYMIAGFETVTDVLSLLEGAKLEIWEDQR